MRIIRLQELTSVTAPKSQDIDQAADIGDSKTLTAQLRVAAIGAGATFKLQHSPALEEDAFEDVASPSWTAVAVGNATQTFSNLHRYVRWTVSGNSGTYRFLIDLTCRST